MDNAWTDVAKGENHTLVRFASGPSPLSDVGGGALLKGEAAGWATDFLYDADPTKRVALKTPPASKTFYAVDDFIANAGTSPKTVYDAAGVLRWSPHNLVNQSKDGNAVGSTFNVTVTQDVTAGPAGDITADQIAFAGGNNGYHYKETLATGVSGVTYCGSVWLKAAAPVQIGLRTTSGDGTGTPGVAIVNVTTAWQRFYTFCTAGSAANINVGLDHRTFVSGDDGLAKTVIAADWQINRGTVPTAYLPTTTAARFGLALDYDPLTHAPRGLLCEPQATNLCYPSAGGKVGSEWIGNLSTRTGGQADPSGGLEALLVAIAAGGVGAGMNVSNTNAMIVLGTVYTYSMWCKGVAGQQIYFTVDTTALPAMQKLITFTGGWQRVSHTYTASASGNSYIGFECYNRTNPAAHLPAVTFTIWGGQIEVGTVATSYIPTLAATVTRAADQVNALAASVGSSTTVGSWWADINLLTNVAPQTIIATGDSAHMPIYGQATTTFGLYDNIAFVGKTVASIAGSHRVASAYQAADRAITADGLTVVTDTTAGVSLGGGPNIGFGYNVTASGQMTGYIRQLRYLPRRPTNAELQAMTALTGGKALLVAELNGMATDFIYAADAERVAVKTAGAVKEFGLDAFYQNTAGSPKQVYTIDGKLGWSPHNLELWSEDFTNAAWIKGGSSIVPNAIIAPNGTLTADKFVEGTGSGNSKYLQQFGARASNGVFSVYAKAGERTKIVLQDWLGGAIGDGFDLVAGVVHVLDIPTLRPTGRSTIKAVGNGWYRCSIGVETGGDCVMYPADDNWDLTYTGDGVSGLYVWGAQLNYGSALVPYIPTTSAAKAGLALDYDPVTHAALGLLCEPQATNAVKWSNDMTNAAVWWGDGAFELNAGVAPNGLMEAMKFSGNGFGEYEDGNFLVGSIPGSITGNVSVYAKAGACTQIFLMSASNTFEGFDLATGTIFVPTYNGAITASSGLGVMRNVGNGWWRCSVKTTAVGDFWMGMCRNKENVSPGSELSVYLWGPQGDSVNPFPTSYIPTFAAAVTRAADTVSVLPAQINYSASAGSWWVDVNLLRKATVYDIIVGYYTGAAPIYMGSATTFDLYDSPGFVSKAVASAVGSHKVAAAFVTADRALTADGLAPGTDASATTMLLDPGGEINIGAYADGSSSIHGYIRKATYLPRRMSNPELQAVTT